MVRRAADPWQGYWDIPGGFCESGEHPADTARREVREEAGVDVEIVALLGMWIGSYETPRQSSPGKTSLSIYYLARCAADGELHADGSESSEVRWFPIDSPPENLAFPSHNASVLKKLTTSRS